jgi:mannose/fructose/N-acetylgalactosamine-specific phosphotransferase system component IIC
MTLLQATLVALYYGLYASQPLILLMGPSNLGAIIGLVIGLIMGDPATGVLVGAWIQVTYLGTVNYGGTKPADQFAASIVAIPIAIATHLPVPIALVLAAIVGAISFPLDTVWKRINTTVWSPRIDAAVERLDYGAIVRSSSVYPMLVRILISTPVVLLLTYFGARAVTWLMSNGPHWLLAGLTVTGLLLAALGFAMFLSALGRTLQIPFFIAGFFAMQFFKIPTLGMAIFGFFLAFLSLAWTDSHFFSRRTA